jgi:hypothetical protein
VSFIVYLCCVCVFEEKTSADSSHLVQVDRGAIRVMGMCFSFWFCSLESEEQYTRAQLEFTSMHRHRQRRDPLSWDGSIAVGARVSCVDTKKIDRNSTTKGKRVQTK